MAKKILIIDDDRGSLTLISAWLNKAGYEISVAGNGRDGLALIGQGSPDLVILDIEMPEMNGYTFVMELKKQDRTKNIPIIVTTAHEENRPIFSRRGIKHYLVKPIKFDELEEKLKELLVPAG